MKCYVKSLKFANNAERTNYSYKTNYRVNVKAVNKYLAKLICQISIFFCVYVVL